MLVNTFSKNIPSGPGIYIFRRGKVSIYIGKAANLKKRVSSYFTPLKQVLTGQGNNTSQKVKQMLREATSLDWIETSSEIEAFLKEAELIKKYRPKYNIVLRDDKNYFYVGITKEKFPRIFITHQPIKNQKLARPFRPPSRPLGLGTKIKNQNNKPKNKNTRHLGPFTSGAALKTTLKLLRRVFPYCICKKPHRRKCLSAQIKKCPGYCCLLEGQNKWSKEQILEYNRNIKNIVAVLSGRQKKIVRQLKKEMREASKRQDFEKAAKLRDQLSGLENIFSHRFFLEDYRSQTSLIPWAKIEREIKVLIGGRKSISRVEGYDISNIFGKEATGSMVVFTEGKPAKEEYRKFRIKTVRGISDIDMLKEVIGRRLNHPEWSLPDLMLIDGGRAQLNAAIAALKFSIFKIRPLDEFTGLARQKQKHLLLAQFSKPLVAALAKREEELYIENRKTSVKLSSLPPPIAFFLQRVRDEAHRFARVYHHSLRKRALT